MTKSWTCSTVEFNTKRVFTNSSFRITDTTKKPYFSYPSPSLLLKLPKLPSGGVKAGEGLMSGEEQVVKTR